MTARLPSALDGIARHVRAEAQIAGRPAVAGRDPARLDRLERFAAAAGPGVTPGQAFGRAPAYRRQLAELLDIAGRSRYGAAL